LVTGLNGAVQRDPGVIHKWLPKGLNDLDNPDQTDAIYNWLLFLLASTSTQTWSCWWLS
jgi:hypothetical protein